MPQGPILVADKNAIPQGGKSKLNLTAATVIKATPGTVLAFAVEVAGSGTGTINDCATVGAVAAANQVCVLPETVGVTVMGWPCTTGIVVTPGTGQTIAVSYI